MWTCSLLKQNAWNSLKTYYWTALGVCVVAALICSFLGGSAPAMLEAPPFAAMFEVDGYGSYDYGYDTGSDFSEGVGAAAISMIYTVVYAISFVWSIAVTIFLTNPITVGQCRFFLSAREGDVAFGHLFDSFSGGKYKNTIKIMGFRFLYTFLWSLLFIIPGIVKSFEYYLIPYLLAENPNLSKDRAFAISKQTMNGEKWHTFVLGLSFIGWALLGALLCGIGVYFVLPYQHATFTEFYACMRAKMIAQGITTEEELSGMKPVMDNMTF